MHETILQCPLKINLTLFVLNKRPDGYHNLYSFFWRRQGPETLAISLGSEGGYDAFCLTGIPVEGTNLVEKGLEWLRKRVSFPPLLLRLHKEIPTQSGVGAGSGNVAALLRWVCDRTAYPLDPMETATLGADIPFMCSSHTLATVEGIGDRLIGADDAGFSGLSCLLLFPTWKSDTTRAYRELDRLRAGENQNTDLEMAKEQTEKIWATLGAGRFIGLLPNDFLRVSLTAHPEYEEFFSSFKDFKAVAWGLCGSGSACFALFEDARSAKNCRVKLRKGKTIQTLVALG